MSDDRQVSRSARPLYLWGAAGLVAISIVAVLFAGHTNANKLAAQDASHLPVGPPVPSVPALASRGWLNTAPLTNADLAGKVVLYDFWTYSCVNCVRTIPYVRAWYDRYRADGLVIIGVHSPEFDFEKVHSNVASAVARLHVTWPVVFDDQMTIWDAFANQYWPADYIADRAGRERATHFGEGDYANTEDILRILLGVSPSSPRAAIGASPAPTTPPAITPETYLGTARGEAGTRPGPAQYPEPGPVATNQARLVGGWIGNADDVQASAAGAAVLLAYRSREVNLVLAAAGGPVDVYVELDGRPLAPSYRTLQTLVDGQGRTYVHVDNSDMYRLVLGPAVEDHLLRLTAAGPGLQAYAFTFGT